MRIRQLTLAALVFMVSAGAWALDDHEADQQIAAACAAYKEKINRKIIDRIAAWGGVQTAAFGIGDCRPFVFGGGQPALALVLPTDFRTTAFTDAGKPTELRFRAGDDNYSRFESLSFKFWWTKTPVHNNLGNIVGYDYRFFVSDGMRTGYTPTRYYYSVSNVKTGDSVGAIGINY
ncbi:MAG TPA: hypothetical protein VFV50_19355 [Bdellovibrionales bacterium]|nr:hypothetical protein [Bdellovibrionales bacterium]